MLGVIIITTVVVVVVVVVVHPLLKAKDGRVLPSELLDPRLVILSKDRDPLFSILGGGGGGSGGLVVVKHHILALLVREEKTAALDVGVEVGGVQGLPALHDLRHAVVHAVG
jgi:hypothetical protein